MSEFRREVDFIIGKHSTQHTPDFVLSAYLIGCMALYDRAMETEAEEVVERQGSAWGSE